MITTKCSTNIPCLDYWISCSLL